MPSYISTVGVQFVISFNNLILHIRLSPPKLFPFDFMCISLDDILEIILNIS